MWQIMPSQSMYTCFRYLQFKSSGKKGRIFFKNIVYFVRKTGQYSITIHGGSLRTWLMFLHKHVHTLVYISSLVGHSGDSSNILTNVSLLVYDSYSALFFNTWLASFKQKGMYWEFLFMYHVTAETTEFIKMQKCRASM